MKYIVYIFLLFPILVTAQTYKYMELVFITIEQPKLIRNIRV